MKQLAKICIYYSSFEFKNLTQVYGIQLSYAGNLALLLAYKVFKIWGKGFHLIKPHYAV